MSHADHVLSSRRGSAYIITLATAMIITVLGLGSMFAIRVQRRSAQMNNELAGARHYAQSAIELGLLYIQEDPNWRQTWPNGQWLTDQPLSSGSFSLLGVDPKDDDLTDSEYDSVVLTGVGVKGQACHKTQITLVPVIQPFKALNTCLHAAGNLKVNGGKMIIAVGAPVSTNGQLDNDGTIDGDAEAATVATIGNITGDLTVPADIKPMPNGQVISNYISKATVIPYTGDIDKQVLTPTYNPWGATNPDGLYYIDTGNNDLTIKNSRIHGTLILDTGDKKVRLDNAIFMHNYRPDYPVLIVKGNAEIKHHSCEYPLSENDCGTNFNPAGAPYLGEWDVDTEDEYPNEVRGLIHIAGELRLQQNARIYGAVICENMIYCEEQNTIIHNPSLYTSPPEGYTFVDGMKVSPGSWRQTVE